MVVLLIWEAPGAWLPGRRIASQGRAADLEVEVVHVRLVEPEGRAEDDRVVLADGVRLILVQALDREALTLGALDLTADELLRDLLREEAEVRDAPETEDRGRAVRDERLHVVREAKAGDLDAIGLLGCRDDLRGREDADRGRGDDDLEVRVLGQESVCLGRADFGFVVAVGGIFDLESLIFGVCRRGLLPKLDS